MQHALARAVDGVGAQLHEEALRGNRGMGLGGRHLQKSVHSADRH